MTGSSVRDVCWRLEELIDLHFDPVWGTPYWLDRKKHLPFDPLKEVHDTQDLIHFGPFPEEHLRLGPAIRFVPRRFHELLTDWVLSETGGTTGAPKRVFFSEAEFRAGFVDPFVEVARAAGWPSEAQWLFLGPTGPHIIGKVIDPICRELGSPAPFRIDFDPRWAKRLEPGSIARDRYLDHLVDQGINVIERESVEVLFGTPPLLERLAGKLPERTRESIRAVHYGGMALSREKYTWFRKELFPKAVHLSGYGNSLVGVAFEATSADSRMLLYYPSATRHHLRVISLEGESPQDRLETDVPFGERGQVVVSRLDATFFLPNLIERDSAKRIAPTTEAEKLGWDFPGVEDPQPLSTPSNHQTSGQGFY